MLFNQGHEQYLDKHAATGMQQRECSNSEYQIKSSVFGKCTSLRLIYLSSLSPPTPATLAAASFVACSRPVSCTHSHHENLMPTSHAKIQQRLQEISCRIQTLKDIEQKNPERKVGRLYKFDMSLVQCILPKLPKTWVLCSRPCRSAAIGQ